MNNFERIKAMSIDEMAEFIANNCINMDFDCSDSLCGDENCINHIKQWLEAESEE